jgi:hypothetical protein
MGEGPVHGAGFQHLDGHVRELVCMEVPTQH